MINFLNAIGFTLLEQGYEIGLDWLGQFVRVIIESVGIVGVGIICFTLILKAITVPFDIYNRVKMRKQTLIMREMQPELEKLQKQYANDKMTYNQKMVELQKKNGYSILGACLPMIISFVIVIVAFQAFRAYSNYANLNFFVQMSEDYNAAILTNGADGIDYTLELQKDENGQIVLDENNDPIVVVKDGVYNLIREDGGESKPWDGSSFTEGDCTYTMSEVNGNLYMTVMPNDENKFLYYIYDLEETSVNREYMIDETRFAASSAVSDETKTQLAEAETDEAKRDVIVSYVKNIGAQAAKTWYDNNDAGFLWIKNVWYPDVSYNHPIPDYATFSNTFGNTMVRFEDGEERALSNVLSEGNYNDLTAALTEEKNEPNGYFILIILSIGVMVLSQFVMMKSQKESNKYQTADGQGAKTQKIMLIVMPLIYAVFAFMYSAAFSLYMTISSIISLCVTLLSNLIIGHVFKKKEEARMVEERNRKPAWLIEREKREAEKNKKK